MITINNVLEVKPTIFPDGTQQVWNLDFSTLSAWKELIITWDYESDSEMMSILQLCDLLGDSYDLCLIIPFLPYARQDKEITNQTTFGLHSFAKFLNLLNVKRIISEDLHSDVGLSLVPKLRNSDFSVRNKLAEIIKDNNIKNLIFPDKGARDRYMEFLKYPANILLGEKTRDSLGIITSLEVRGELVSGNSLIVDDICDGGATFIGLMSNLDRSAGDIYLYVTHGIFSKGTDCLFNAGIKRIFTHKGEVK